MSELLKINVNEHTEKKGGLTYLSWAWAWAEVLKVDPDATWYPMYFHADGAPKSILLQIGDETAMVGVTVTIKGVLRQCLLPVMDHKNKAIQGPNAFQVNTALMRCMTKAVSLFGLGLYIYAGEDLPEADKAEDASLVPILTAAIAHEKAKKTGVMADVLDNLPPATPEEKAYLNELADTVHVLFEERGILEAFDRLEDEQLDNEQKIRLWALLPSNVRSALKKEGAARKEPA